MVILLFQVRHEIVVNAMYCWTKESVTFRYYCPYHDLRLLFVIDFHLPGIFITMCYKYIYIYIRYCIILKDIFIHTNCTVPYFDTNWCSCIKWVFIISWWSDNLKHLIFHCFSKCIHIIVWREDFLISNKMNMSSWCYISRELEFW